MRVRKILVVDDHGIVRDGLIALLGRAGGMQVVGCAGSGEEAVLAARGLRPDVIVMDLVMPALNGFDATRRILAEEPLTHIIVLSGCHTSEHVHRALLAGQAPSRRGGGGAGHRQGGRAAAQQPA